MASNIISASIGALGDIVGGLASNGLSAYQAKQLANYQAKLNYKYAKKSALNMPTYNRQGIESAGYNPMLALGSIGSANSSWTSATGLTTPDFSGTGSSAVNNALAVKQQQNQDRTTDATIDNTNAHTVLLNSQAISETFKQINMSIDSQLKEKERDLKQLDIKNYERNQIRQDINTLTNYQDMLNRYELGIQANNIAGMNAVSNRINADSNSQDVQTRSDALQLEKDKFAGSEDKFMRDFAEDHPKMYATYRHLDNTVGLLGRIFGGAGTLNEIHNSRKTTSSDYTVNNYGYNSKGQPVRRSTTHHHKVHRR